MCIQIYSQRKYELTTRTIKKEVACGLLRVKQWDGLGWVGWTSDEIVSPPAEEKAATIEIPIYCELNSIEEH